MAATAIIIFSGRVIGNTYASKSCGPTNRGVDTCTGNRTCSTKNTNYESSVIYGCHDTCFHYEIGIRHATNSHAFVGRKKALNACARASLGLLPATGLTKSNQWKSCIASLDVGD
jgi:hypothetical protein